MLVCCGLLQVVSQIVAALKKLPREGLPPSGVMTFWETAVPLAARVAEGLGCVAHSLGCTLPV